MAIYVKLKMIDVTMKKIYINPAIQVVKITSQIKMLAGSDMQNQGDYNSSSITIASRKSDSVWDDEDEEYEDY